jgi:hypothetical protein
LYEYTFRSRATIGPPQLAKFMQDLFLSDPEEIQRRARVFLPVLTASVPSRPNGNGSSNGNGSGHHILSSISVNRRSPEAGSSPGFDERTPLLDAMPEVALKPIEEEISLSGLASSVAFIAPDEQWERASSPFDGEPRDHTYEEGPLFESAESGELKENTARTDVPISLGSQVEAIDIHTGHVLSIGFDDRPVDQSDSTQAPFPDPPMRARRQRSSLPRRARSLSTSAG